MESTLFIRREKCPICFSDKLELLYKRGFNEQRMKEYIKFVYQDNAEFSYLTGQDFEVVRCLNCGFIFQSNILNSEGTQRLYDKWIDPDLAEKWHNLLVYKDIFILAQRLSFVVKYFGTTDIRVLDYGGGLGQFCLMARGFALDVYSIELSNSRTSTMTKNGIRVFLPEEIKKKTKYFHFINISQVLEHLSNPLKVLKDIYSALRDEGIVFVSVPDCRNLRRKIKNLEKLPLDQFASKLSDVSALQHINCFTHSTLKKTIREAGFEIISQPLLFIGCSLHGTTIKEFFKNLIRPFYYRFSTSFFLCKQKDTMEK